MESSPLDRRNFLRLAPAAGVMTTSCATYAPSRDTAVEGSWEWVRSEFELSPEVIDFAALLISSHPRAVRDAIARHRRGLDENPTVYLQSELSGQDERALKSAAEYFGARPEDIALTDSTTMGLALVYHGFSLKPAQEFLVSEHNYYSTLESIRLSAARSGARVRYFPLYENPAAASVDEIVGKTVAAVGAATRVLALTWVHSSTGVKLPLQAITGAIAEINRDREPSERVLVCVDGVHGFGLEDSEMSGLGCDFFMAGCHKWLFGPRGTGVIIGTEAAWGAVTPTIPTFMDSSVRRSWIAGRQPTGSASGARMTPGGFKAYEHRWAVAEAFDFHQKIGKSRIAARTHELSRMLKQGLRAMPHVTLYTPASSELSAGIVCFDVSGMKPQEVVAALRARNIVATTTPYAPSHARLTPSIRNSPEEIEAVLREIHSL